MEFRHLDVERLGRIAAGRDAAPSLRSGLRVTRYRPHDEGLPWPQANF